MSLDYITKKNFIKNLLLTETSLEFTDLSNMSKYKKKGTPLKSQKYFVIHHTGGGGSAEDVMNVLNNRKGGALGVQYIIDEDGKVFRGLPSGTVGAHVSGSNRIGGPSDLSNSNTEGVEIVGGDDTKITLNQCKTALLLIKSLGYSSSDVYGHGELQSNKMPSEGSTCKRYVKKYWSTPEDQLPTEDPEITKKQGIKIDKDSEVNDDSKEVKNISLAQTYYNGKAKSNIDFIISKLKGKGITNPMVQAAILATIGKESGFIPQNEIGYGSTPNTSIRKRFSATKKLSDEDLDRLKSNDKEFFNYVYGPKGVGPGLGNTQSDDGYKYRGRGFNQITGRGNYKAFGYENNPDDLNDTNNAANAMVEFLAKEGSELNNKFSNQDEALEFFVTRNNGGRPSSNGVSKAKEVLSKFNVGTVDGGTYSDDTTTSSDNTTTSSDDNKTTDPLEKFKDFRNLFDILGGQKELGVNEETNRIKDIMKKVL